MALLFSHGQYKERSLPEEEVVDPILLKLHGDLLKLNDCLDETSWSECLFCYIDLMDRYYTSEASSTGSGLRGFPVTIVDDDEMNDEDYEQNTDEIADGYTGYLGPLNGKIRNAYHKLMQQDPWYLNAEEILALLRALTDDILAANDELAQEIVNRDEELNELLKAKKSTEYNFRKARVAYEGPKKKKKVPGANINEDKNSSEMISGKEDDLKKKNEDEKKFKPTISRGEFESAENSRNQAIEAYEKGLKQLLVRTEPIGFDRFHNAVYYFNHNPESLFIEKNGIQGGETVKSWHIIDNRFLFEEFVSSLDIRGIRESKLHCKISGDGEMSNIKRLLSNNKKNALICARQRDEEDFNRRLNDAMIACASEEAAAIGRRSSRLKTGAQVCQNWRDSSYQLLDFIC